MHRLFTVDVLILRQPFCKKRKNTFFSLCFVLFFKEETVFTPLSVNTPHSFLAFALQNASHHIGIRNTDLTVSNLRVKMFQLIITDESLLCFLPQGCPQYWPEEGMLRYGPVQVECMSCSMDCDVISRLFRICNLTRVSFTTSVIN